MARKWEVVITKPMLQSKNDYPHNFFPRGCHYVRDAKDLVEEVRRKGGDAEVRRVSNAQRTL